LIRSLLCLHAAILFMGMAAAQSVERSLRAGNKAYREGAYQAAAEAYRKALSVDEAHPVANHNLASALYRSNDLSGAERYFDKAATSGEDRLQTARSWYAKGVSLSRQGRTEESIQAYKQSLRIDPSNEWARENLVRALREKKRKDSEQEQNTNKDHSQDTDKQPPPMDRRDMQRLLDALREQEKRIRQKAGKSGAGVPESREKDW
jgi:tetratricopeptide (TPR) repeat protein